MTTIQLLNRQTKKIQELETKLAKAKSIIKWFMRSTGISFERKAD